MGWWWVGVFVVLGLAGLAVVGGIAWGLVRRGIGVGTDLAEAGARLGELAAQVEHLPAAPREAPAVFADPARLRRERSERLRRARRTRARARSRAKSGAAPAG